MKSVETRKAAPALSSRSPLGLLLTVLIAVNLPYWNNNLWPNTDTINCFQVFYTFYNNWFLHGEFTRWFPYGNCGIQADYWQLFNLTPAAYLVGLLGRLFRVTNVLWLFKFSILLEQAMMLYGLFLLCGKLFRHAAARFLVCLGVMLSTVWLFQIYWNFRIYYLLPLIFYLLIQWMETSRWRHLFLAGTVGVFSLVGNVAYFGALYLLLFLLFLGVAFLHARPHWKDLARPRREDALWLVLFLVSAGLYLYFAAHMLDHIRSLPDGRDPVSKQMLQNRFLVDGSGLGFLKFCELVFPLPGQDYTFYLGFLPLVFIAYALLQSRHSPLLVFLAPTLYLALLSVGDALPVALWTYRFFPPMRWFHYIGQVTGLLRFFLLVCAGFGFDQFLSDLKAKPSSEDRRAAMIIPPAACGVLVVVGGACYVLFEKLRPESWGGIYFILLALLVVSGAALALFSRKEGRWVALLVPLLLALDLGVFQYYVVQSWPCCWPMLDPVAYRVRPYEFQLTRTAEPEEGTKAYEAQRAVEAHPSQRSAVEGQQFMQFDVGGGGKYLGMFWAKGLNRFLEVAGNLTAWWEQGDLIWSVKESVLESPAMGWKAPKLRVLDAATYAPDEETACRMVQQADLFHAPVLETTPVGSGRVGASRAMDEVWWQLGIVSFTYNHIEVVARIQQPEGAWLYYADSYHPGWRAWVNGKEVPIVRANLAFKAIRLDEGAQRVRFAYWDGPRGMAAIGIALSSLLFAAGLIVLMVRLVYFGR